MEKSEKNTKALVAAVLGNMLWGFALMFTRIGQQYALPPQQLAHRFTLAFLLSTLMILFRTEKYQLKGKKLRPLLLLCLCELSCFFFESYGIFYSNSTTAGIFMAISPIAAMLLAALFLREYPTRWQAAWSILPIVGVIIISAVGNSLGVVRALGLFLLLMYCLSSGAYKTINRSASREFTPFERMYTLMGACAVTFSTVTLFQLKGDMEAFFAPLLHWQYDVSILTLSIFASIVANMLINYASGDISVTEMATLGSLTTVCSTFAGIVFLHEPFNILILLGVVLILVGVWMVTTQKNKKSA